jgi:hypothetical protein
VTDDISRATTGETLDFAREAERRRVGFLAELWGFMRHSKKWWLTPIILVLLLVGALVAVGSSAAAPFLYPLF